MIPVSKQLTSSGHGAQLQLGPPGARITFPASALLVLARPFGRKPIESLVRFTVKSVRIYVDQPDHGEMDVHLYVTNFSARKVCLEGLHLDWVRLSGHAVKELTHHLSAPVVEVAPRSMETLDFTLLLHAPDIRTLIGAIGRPPQPLCSPSLGVEIVSQCLIRSWRGARWVRLAVSCPYPELGIYIPGS